MFSRRFSITSKRSSICFKVLPKSSAVAIGIGVGEGQPDSSGRSGRLGKGTGGRYAPFSSPLLLLIDGLLKESGTALLNLEDEVLAGQAANRSPNRNVITFSVSIYSRDGKYKSINHLTFQSRVANLNSGRALFQRFLIVQLHKTAIASPALQS